MIGRVGCNEDINNNPVLETMARYDSDNSISAAFQHSSLSLRYTDIDEGKKVRKVLTIGYGYNNKNNDIFPNLSIETTGKEDYDMVGIKIDISEDILKRILNYTFNYYNIYNNKYNILTRNCNSFVKGFLREVRRGKKTQYRHGIDKKTDWSALEEAYKNHKCVSPAAALKRSFRQIKKNSKNSDKYFYSLGCVGFIGIKDDRVMLPTMM